jgi:class 3 adenylate cyclase
VAVEHESRNIEDIVSSDRIAEMSALADRLRLAGALDDATLEAISEATGASPDLVRAVMANTAVGAPEQKLNPVARLRESLVAMDSRVRRLVISTSLGVGAGMLAYFANTVVVGDQLLRSFAVLGLAAGIAALSLARERKQSALLGGLLGLAYYLSYQVFATFTTFVLRWMPGEMPWGTIFAWVGGGVLAGAIGFSVVRMFQSMLGLRDATTERQMLVQQLVEIQDRLRSEERHATFLSLDIVGSTRMKMDNDPIAIEYTFSEYHRYVEQLALKHGGRIHSTAGDGVICVFEDASRAFSAGRAMMAGLFEFNAFRNKTKDAIQLRSGMHTGRVGAPGQDASTVNFAHVIDVAAHMQKCAEPGTMAVSQHSLDMMPGGGVDQVTVDRIEVEGIPAAIWSPKTRALSIPMSVQ